MAPYRAPRRALKLHESRAELDRFYFHVENGSRYPDETGSVFSTPGDAMVHATVLSQELAPDISRRGLSIVVADERGREIARVRIGQITLLEALWSARQKC
ncbi:MAG: DUF6894 family protein [Bradyrhizobium sp.]